MKKINLRYTLLLLFLFCYCLLVVLFWKLYTADTNYESSQKNFVQQDYETALTDATKAIKLNPREPAYYRQRAKTLIMLALTTQKSELKARAYDDLITAYTLNKNNLATIRNSVPLLYFLSLVDYTQPAILGNIDPTFFKLTKNYYATVKNISKNDVGMYVLFAKYEKKLGLKSEYADSISKIKQLRPDLLTWIPDL